MRCRQQLSQGQREAFAGAAHLLTSQPPLMEKTTVITAWLLAERVRLCCPAAAGKHAAGADQCLDCRLSSLQRWRTGATLRLGASCASHTQWNVQRRAGCVQILMDPTQACSCCTLSPIALPCAGCLPSSFPATPAAPQAAPSSPPAGVCAASSSEAEPSAVTSDSTSEDSEGGSLMAVLRTLMQLCQRNAWLVPVVDQMVRPAQHKLCRTLSQHCNPCLDWCLCMQLAEAAVCAAGQGGVSDACWRCCSGDAAAAGQGGGRSLWLGRHSLVEQ